MRGYDRDMREPVTVNRANRHRGEVEGVIDGERRILCLTLGALAELETAFGADSLTDLAARFAGGRLKSADLTRILACGLRGGGNRVSDADVADMVVEGGVAGAAKLVGELLALTFGVSADERRVRDEQGEGGTSP
ncbi:gene transfer agent family protein [Allorhizobium sp. NPDC080224]|uniref:gene transfer agent family protein n=1 Tax=Allorhizobium sp. NPDC080224 TaxID=3390547 RepID=UPI003D079504